MDGSAAKLAAAVLGNVAGGGGFESSLLLTGGAGMACATYAKLATRLDRVQYAANFIMIEAFREGIGGVDCVPEEVKRC